MNEHPIGDFTRLVGHLLRSTHVSHINYRRPVTSYAGSRPGFVRRKPWDIFPEMAEVLADELEAPPEKGDKR